MKPQTIGSVSKAFGISARTLRYYEQIGLIEPVKHRHSAYRVYDEAAVSRLRHIIVLRKLRIPLRRIAEIFQSRDATVAIAAFEQSIAGIDDEIAALSTIRDITKTFMRHLRRDDEYFSLPDDQDLLEVVNALTTAKLTFKEANTMDDLNRASAKLNRLTDVRIVHLPPMTVAAASATGENCEEKTGDMLRRFALENDLFSIKPDVRFFGFDCSEGKAGMGENSLKYQSWISIPDDMDVPAPLVRRAFSGGLYAAHMIVMGAFSQWALLGDWVRDNPDYAPDFTDPRVSPRENGIDGCLEEQLNYFGNAQNPDFAAGDTQFDLLFPIRKRE